MELSEVTVGLEYVKQIQSQLNALLAVVSQSS